MQVITSNTKRYIVLAIVFSVVISFNFTKPFGFFRESNPALVSITATYWKQHPEIRKQHIPIYSYAFRKDLPPSTQFDNTITTFGYAWFAVPYYFLQLTNIPAGPVGLRIFSVVWLLFTAFAIYKLASQLTKQLVYSKQIRLITITLYVLSPVVLWYQVNGYVHETAVLPFYYFGWYFFFRSLQEKKTRWLWLTAIFLFTGIQFDWLPFFQGTVMSVYLLFRTKQKLRKWMFLVPGSAVLMGVGYIIYHYASWASFTGYVQFMKWKFGTRTVGEKGPSYISLLPPNLNILFFYVLSYGALLIWAVYGLIKRKFNNPFLLLMIVTAVLHHLVFWGFSSEHDYAALKTAFPIAFAVALVITDMKKRTAVISFTLILFCAIAQYILLHNYSYRKGMYEDGNFFVKAGEAIRKHPARDIVFLNTEGKYFPQVEFYAGRDYKMASSVEDAFKQLKNMNSIENSVFIEIKNGKAIEKRLTGDFFNHELNSSGW